MREPQERERRGPLQAVAFTKDRCQIAETNQRGLRRLYFKSKTPQAIRERTLEGARVVFKLKTSHKVVRETHQKRLAPTLASKTPLEPYIQTVVQVDVGQHGADQISLRGTLVGGADRTLFHDTRLEKTLDESQQVRVPCSMRQKPLHVLVRDAAEIIPEV